MLKNILLLVCFFTLGLRANVILLSNVPPGLHPNYAVQINAPTNINTPGIKNEDLLREFPQTNFAFNNANGRNLIGYFGDQSHPFQLVVWTTLALPAYEPPDNFIVTMALPPGVVPPGTSIPEPASREVVVTGLVLAIFLISRLERR